MSSLKKGKIWLWRGGSILALLLLTMMYPGDLAAQQTAPAAPPDLAAQVADLTARLGH